VQIVGAGPRYGKRVRGLRNPDEEFIPEPEPVLTRRFSALAPELRRTWQQLEAGAYGGTPEEADAGLDGQLWA
jgi:hypothetical protein